MSLQEEDEVGAYWVFVCSYQHCHHLRLDYLLGRTELPWEPEFPAGLQFKESKWYNSRVYCHSPIHTNSYSASMSSTFSMWGNSGFSILPEDTSAYRWLDRDCSAPWALKLVVYWSKVWEYAQLKHHTNWQYMVSPCLLSTIPYCVRDNIRWDQLYCPPGADFLGGTGGSQPPNPESCPASISLQT